MYKTYIVLGNMRGGTSMVAGTMRILGINMGDNIDPHNHEDLDLQHRHYLHMRDLVAKKNEEHNVWGWKDPMLIDQIYDVIDLCPLRHPIFIVVHRDAVATTQALVREEGWGWHLAFNHVAAQTIRLFDFQSSYPNHISISYEKSLADPKSLVDKMISHFGLEVDEETRQRAIDFIAPGYKAI